MELSDLNPLPLLRKLIRALFLLVMTVLFCFGLVLVIASSAWELGEILRDIGIAMLVAGTVGLGVELFSRREMENVLGVLIEQKLAETAGKPLAALETAVRGVDQQIRMEAEKLRSAEEDMHDGFAQVQDLVVRASGLQDLGIRRLSLHREDGLLREFIESAKPGSTIRVLALCLNTLANHAGEDLFEKKLEQGCRIRLLLIDPGADAMLEERARQEGLTKDEEIRELKAKVRTWDSMHRNAVQHLAANKELPGSIELGYYQCLPSCFLIDNGETMLVGFYLQGCRGDQCLHLEIEQRQSGAYQQFDRHFEAQWARRTIPVDRRQQDEPVENERKGLRIA